MEIGKNTALFRDMTETEIQTALDRLSAGQRTYGRGETVFHAGTRTERLGLILSGSVTIESGDPWGGRTILSLAEAGELFGETYALLGSAPMMVDVVANESSRILFLGVGRLMEGPAQFEDWQAKLLRNLLLLTAQKNLALSSRSFHTSPKTARGRVLAYLQSVSLAQGSREFDIPFDRQQMADYLNLDRTALSKELGRMGREGLLRFRKNHFAILAPGKS